MDWRQRSGCKAKLTNQQKQISYSEGSCVVDRVTPGHPAVGKGVSFLVQGAQGKLLSLRDRGLSYLFLRYWHTSYQSP